MHKPLSCVKGQVRPCRLGVRVLLCPWLGLVFLSLLPSWGGAGGWARFRGVGLVGGSGVLFFGGLWLPDDESTRRALYTYARCEWGVVACAWRRWGWGGLGGGILASCNGTGPSWVRRLRQAGIYKVNK